MKNSQAAQLQGISLWFTYLWRRLLIVPESGLMLVVVLAIVLSGGHIAAIWAAVLVAAWFLVRTGALVTARGALDLGADTAAGLLLRLSLLLCPWSPDALALSGLLALRRGQAVHAEGLLRRASALLPNNPMYSLSLSSALLDQGRAQEAVSTARSVLTAAPQQAMVYLAVAEAERVNGASTEVIEDLLRSGIKQAQDVNDEAALHCALARHLLEIGRVAEGTLAVRSAEALLPRCRPMRQAEIRSYLGELVTQQPDAERMAPVGSRVSAVTH